MSDSGGGANRERRDSAEPGGVPVSQYEALLAEVRGLRRRTQRVQRLARPLLQGSSIATPRDVLGLPSVTVERQSDGLLNEPLDYTMESLLLDSQQHTNVTSQNYDRTPADRSISSRGIASTHSVSSEEEWPGGRGRNADGSHLSVNSEPTGAALDALYHGTAWSAVEGGAMWNSEPGRLGEVGSSSSREGSTGPAEACSVMSFASSAGAASLDGVFGSGSGETSKWPTQQLEAKMDVVHRLLGMLGSQEHVDMGDTLLALSACPESCAAMRQSGCIPLLVRLAQTSSGDERRKAALALRNLIDAQPDERLRKRETRTLALLEQARRYVDRLRGGGKDAVNAEGEADSEDEDKHPVQTVAHLMKLSFDEGHRQAICQLGGIHTIAHLIEGEHQVHGNTATEPDCILLRRYACMTLTNLTFGDSGNKKLLCSYRDFMRALVVQLENPSDELRQVTASVLRNLSWRADPSSKEVLREVGSVTGLMKAAMMNNKENTLKSMLQALWNLSAYCMENQSEICAVDGAISFLVSTLVYKSPSKSLAIIENGGGILRNISSQIAFREDYREILRKHNCFRILLDQLKSPSLTIVSNACGTLWNLSAKCAKDQETLWQMGAPAMLRSLNHSKHKMIAMGSSAALKNLLSAKPNQTLVQQLDSTALSLNLPELPTLGARKQKALLKDLDANLSETYENIDKESPVKSKIDKGLDIIEFVEDTRNKTRLKEVKDDINQAFSSLTLTEPSTSYAEARPKSRIPQSYGSTSLPYMSPSVKGATTCAYIPVRNKFTDYEDESMSDQPIDYSRKYSETKASNDANKVSCRKNNTEFSKDQDNNENYNIYAETDLDQPTDYSLRYAEDDSDTDVCGKVPKTEHQVFDTVKTYCTEGTPYESPFIISTATSMSDLRDKHPIDNDIQKEKEKKDKEIKNQDEKDHCSTEDISETETAPKPCDRIPKSEFSSGLMSPEKPVNYCEEGTPGYFSRVSSFGSLTSIPANETVVEKTDAKLESTVDDSDKKDNRKQEAEKGIPKTPNETKNVKFETTVNYAEQTPLMFSRTSSLASLDSMEQHSIHDDRSSVVSDFSRLTSGVISPSELPDSPSQTVPPSPRPRKSLEFPSTSRRRSSSEKSQPMPKLIQKSSVFEDNITKFKEESTPIQFSTATSLSSLTIDDHEENEVQSNTKVNELNILKPSNTSSSSNTNADSVIHKEDQQEKKDAEKEARNSGDFNQESEVESDDVDEDILLACINEGKQNDSPAEYPTGPVSSSTPSRLPAYKYKAASTSIPIMSRSPRPLHTPPIPHQEEAPKTYYTEDTPAQLSRTGSNSNLSALSTPNDKKKGDYLSDDSSNLSGDNENILAECIQSAIPKASSLSKPSGVTRRSGLVKYGQPVLTGLGQRSGDRGVRSTPPGAAEVRQVPARRVLHADVPSRYAVEGSPCEQFSGRSSLSDLSTSAAGGADGSSRTSKNQSQEPLNTSEASGSKILARAANEEASTGRKEDSLSSSESLEDDRLLLEQCIYSAMPPTRTDEALLRECIQAGMPQDKQKEYAQNPATRPLPPVPGEQNYVPEPRPRARSSQKGTAIEDSDRNPKNANAASVAGSTTAGSAPLLPATREGGSPSPAVATTTIASNIAQQAPAAGVAATDNGGRRTENGREAGRVPREEAERSTAPSEGGARSPRPRRRDSSQDTCSPTDGTSSTELEKSGSNQLLGKMLADSFENNVDARLAKSCDESNILDNRMLDPDAMIESLDRFTAELVSQASHLNKDDDKYKVSTNDNTWNEDTSPNEVTFPSISGSAPNVITFGSDASSKDAVDGLVNEAEHQSNDFSSVNTNTMTESTIIALEATRMATVFKHEAEMSQSLISAASLDLDAIRPPSQLNSLTSSGVNIPRSPKLVARKKSLPAGLLVKRALSNSLNHASSVESLENHSFSNLDNMNPPSDIQNVFDMESSMTSIGSLPNDNADVRTDFIINGPVSKDSQETQHNPIFNVKQPFTSSLNSCIDIDNINPPSLFNEITDMCSSLADVPTEAICSETEAFEDCFTHVADITLQDDDPTIFSDANSATPIQSDLSSAESTPKKSNKPMGKYMMTKQRRNLARDRYKTYVVGAEMVMREEESTLPDSTTGDDDFHTVRDDLSDATTYVSPTYTVAASKITPKERRQMNPSRFETQVLDEAITSISQQPIVEPVKNDEINSSSGSASPVKSPVKTKLSIRRNFLQKRLENKERFKTRTISESSFSPELSTASPPLAETDIHLLVQKEADLVLKTLANTKAAPEDMLDLETLSLVSNDDDSEQNSASSINYRTYRKSYGMRQHNIPVIGDSNGCQQNDLVNCQTNLTYDPSKCEQSDEDNEHEKLPAKPKIIKPVEKIVNAEEPVEEQGKGIRGRRKPLYSKSNLNSRIAPKTIKPVKTVTSNLVKNVTSSIKSGSVLKTVTNKQAKPVSKVPSLSSRTSSGYGSKPVSKSSSPKTSPARIPKPPVNSKQTKLPQDVPALERQGTFTKEEVKAHTQALTKPASKMPGSSRIPAFTSKIAKTVSASKIPTTNNNSTKATSINTSRNGIKSADFGGNKNMRVYNRSTSADSREANKKIQPSASSQSLKTETKTTTGVVRKPSLPSPARRSNSNSSITSNASTSTRKQVTSKIASIWKRIEETKNQPQKKDTRVWIQNQPESVPEPARLIRSNTFDNKDAVILRNKNSSDNIDGDETKRISRLGSFIVMDDTGDGVRLQQTICSATTAANV